MVSSGPGIGSGNVVGPAEEVGPSTAVGPPEGAGTVVGVCWFEEVGPGVDVRSDGVPSARGETCTRVEVVSSEEP